MGLQGDAEENLRMGDIVSAGLAEDAAITQHSDAVQDAENAVRNRHTCSNHRYSFILSFQILAVQSKPLSEPVAAVPCVQGSDALH